LFSTGSLNSTTLPRGDGGKALFSPLKVGKTSKSPFRAVSQLILSSIGTGFNGPETIIVELHAF